MLIREGSAGVAEDMDMDMVVAVVPGEMNLGYGEPTGRHMKRPDFEEGRSSSLTPVLGGQCGDLTLIILSRRARGGEEERGSERYVRMPVRALHLSFNSNKRREMRRRGIAGVLNLRKWTAPLSFEVPLSAHS